MRRALGLALGEAAVVAPVTASRAGGERRKGECEHGETRELRPGCEHRGPSSSRCGGATATSTTSKEGGTGTDSELLDTPQEMPERLEAGTPNTWGLAGLLAGVEHLLASGVHEVREREQALARELRERLARTPRVTLHGPRDAESVGIVSFQVAGLSPADVAHIRWARHRVACRAGLHCAPAAHEAAGTLAGRGTVRFGLGWANGPEDVDRAAEAVTEIARLAYATAR